MTHASAESNGAVRPPTGRRGHRLSRFEWNERLVLGVLGLVLVLALWEVGSAVGYLNRVIMSSPSGVLRALVREIERGEIWSHIGVSILEFVLGFILATVVGVLIGFVAGWWRRANYLLDPWITILYSTPTVALIPLIILFLGIELGSKVFIVFLISLFPVIVNTLIGVQSTGRALLDVARVFGASPVKQWVSVVVPGSVPFILTGLRLAGVHGMVGVVVAELVAGNEGIGFVINRAGASLQSGTVMLGILFLGLWGVLFGEAIRRVEARFEAWRP
jgi:ABC-type nitrate/sulfonate/bicarbonate transport system permease component